MTAKERASCNVCGSVLESLGRLELRQGGASAVVGYWSCPACGRTWVHHSERGWRETTVDLQAE